MSHSREREVMLIIFLLLLLLLFIIKFILLFLQQQEIPSLTMETTAKKQKRSRTYSISLISVEHSYVCPTIYRDRMRVSRKENLFVVVVVLKFRCRQTDSLFSFHATVLITSIPNTIVVVYVVLIYSYKFLFSSIHDRCYN